MPQLTKSHLSQLKQRLAIERRLLLSEARDELDRARSGGYAVLAGEVPDYGDQSTAASLVDYDNTMARRHNAALQEIDAALSRLDEGSYGRCVDCDDDIARGRLEAFPVARRCTACQSQRERTYAHEATPSL
jgi:RNA polymerase-binding transcription factor DksA